MRKIVFTELLFRGKIQEELDLHDRRGIWVQAAPSGPEEREAVNLGHGRTGTL